MKGKYIYRDKLNYFDREKSIYFDEIIQTGILLLNKLKEFQEFSSELLFRLHSETEYIHLLKFKGYDKALLQIFLIFIDFINFTKSQQSLPKRVAELYDSRSGLKNSMEKPSSRTSKYSDLDQEINEQKRLFSTLCKEIAQSINPESLGSGSDYDES